MKNKNCRFALDNYKGHELKDGSYSVVLVVSKQSKRKTIVLPFSASYVEIKKRDGNTEIKSQWNQSFQRFEVDGRKGLHPDSVDNNSYLEVLSGRCDELINDFEKNKTDWTLNQFEQALLNKSKKTGIEAYFTEYIDKLDKTNKIGNKICYQNTLDMLKKNDPTFSERIFNEIDLKYVNKFSEFLDQRGCVGNTKKYYIKTLRSLINKAIKEGKASEVTYPFGKNGYSIADLEQETDKRYLPNNYIEKMKIAELKTYPLNWSRNLFLFSYYCQGMSFVDMAGITTESIKVLEGGKYIQYRRQKTERKKTRFIRIKITEQIQTLLDWFKNNCKLIDGYLLPVVSIAGYESEKLYTHIRDRYKRYNNRLKSLGTELEFEGIRLSSYQSRHSYAMRLKNTGAPEDVISEALGHKELSTTKVYLDSFQNNEVDKANENL
jgi:integrase